MSPSRSRFARIIARTVLARGGLPSSMALALAVGAMFLDAGLHRPLPGAALLGMGPVWGWVVTRSNGGIAGGLGFQASRPLSRQEALVLELVPVAVLGVLLAGLAWLTGLRAPGEYHFVSAWVVLAVTLSGGLFGVSLLPGLPAGGVPGRHLAVARLAPVVSFASGLGLWIGNFWLLSSADDCAPVEWWTVALTWMAPAALLALSGWFVRQRWLEGEL